MGALRNFANTVFRNFRVEGDPQSGAHTPKKADIRSLFGQAEDSLAASIETVEAAAAAAAASAASISFASEAEAEAGTLEVKVMSPARTFDAVAAYVASHNLDGFQGNRVDVRDFAVDPTGTNESTAAFQQFLDALKNGSVEGNLIGLEGFVPQGVYMIGAVPIYRAFGGGIFGERGTRLKRIRGHSCPVLAIQGDECHIEGLTFDSDWAVGTSEVFGTGNPYVQTVYLAGNYNEIKRCRFLNGSHSLLGLNGMQRFGVNLALPVNGAYSAPTSALYNKILDCFFKTARGGGIEQFWARGTEIKGCRIDNTGAESITFDTYTQLCDVQGNFLRDACTYDGASPRLGGVGAIGIDSGFRNRIIGNFIERVLCPPVASARLANGGIVFANEENNSIENVIANNIIKDTEGPGILLRVYQTQLSQYLAAGTWASADRNIIHGNSFQNCGLGANYRNMLPAPNKPAATAMYLDYNAARPLQHNWVGPNMNFGHAMMDAPDANNANTAGNPNNTHYVTVS